MRAPLLLALALLAPLAAASPLLLPPAGPDVPTTNAPVAVVVAFDRELWSFTEGTRTRHVVVPDVTFDRVLVRFVVQQGTDPWDRLFGVSIGGAEVLRGTTPRADMTLVKDVTAYMANLPAGATVPIGLHFGTWVGWSRLTVQLEFHDDPTTAPLVTRPFDAVVSPFAFARLHGDGHVLAADAAFPATAPARAVVELTTTGHAAGGEFWYLNGDHLPPTFRILVDGTDVGHATAFPYVYALAGIGRGSLVLDTANTAMWWSAHRGLDTAGVHTGNGEIPPYRAELPVELLPLLQGARRVEVVQEGGLSVWITGLTFLLEEA